MLLDLGRIFKGTPSSRNIHPSDGASRLASTHELDFKCLCAGHTYILHMEASQEVNAPVKQRRGLEKSLRGEAHMFFF